MTDPEGPTSKQRIAETTDKAFSQPPSSDQEVCVGESLPCSFAEEDPGLQLGRVCRLDHVSCFNFGNPDLVQRCPTLGAHLRGEPTGCTADLDFPGPPHVVESGPLNDHVTGMPQEYLASRLKK